MKTFANVLVTLLWLPIVFFFACWDAMREHRQHRRLGRHYEGPREDHR